MELRLKIRQNAVYNLQGQQVYYSGTNPQNLVPITGTLPASRQWLNYGNFIDVTEYVSDISELQLTWTIQRDEAGTLSAKNELKKSASGQLTFEGLAYDLIKSWLIDDVSAGLNSVEVMIEDISCGVYRGYIIASNDLQFCEDGICQYSVILKQQDEQLACIKRTLVSDNWQGWFPENGIPTNGKKHPRFSYCNEARPNAWLVVMWYVLTMIFNTSFVFILPLLLAINPILWIIQQIQNILNTNWNIPPPINMSDIWEGISTIYIETSGCGREHPSPLIRDYITNVCDKCGVGVNAQTFPLFFAQTTTINTSTGVETGTNEYYNTCYFNAPVKRGLRRVQRLSLVGGMQGSNNQYWIDDNKPLMALNQFLDQVLGHFNFEWRLMNGYLYAGRRDEMNRVSYLYDFTNGSSDRDKLVGGICYDPTNEKYPASMTGIYAPDAMDACGNEAGNINGTGQMNGVVNFVATDPLSSNLKPVNPLFDGVLTKQSAFGATRFRFDGVSGDYIYDAAQVVLNGSILSPIGQFSTLQAALDSIDEISEYALLLQSEIASNPKLIIWDGGNYESARAIKTKAPKSGTSIYPIPAINVKYNLSNMPWDVKHPPDTDVIGKNLTFSASPAGIYRVTDYFGIVAAERSALLPNYPMYFEPNFKGTLWDRFHWIDDPNANPKMNFTWSAKLELCCEDLKKIECLNDATRIVLNERVKLPFGYYQYGTINEITVSYKPDEETGRYIELKGKM